MADCVPGSGSLFKALGGRDAVLRLAHALSHGVHPQQTEWHASITPITPITSS